MADVVEEDISAGSQDDEMTRHHSSSLRGTRPRPSDTPVTLLVVLGGPGLGQLLWARVSCPCP